MLILMQALLSGIEPERMNQTATPGSSASEKNSKA
jgi:hypothetical protein